ncbi:hypothetical protein SAMN05414139_04699 [Burkholderia sp. D7]|nr:hypothetical protein SAMN05414139_04699 [Burkholderia sp. D7]
MKKTLCVFALIATLPHIACAQSSVTPAGNDVANRGGAHQDMMSSGVNNGSRFIFAGLGIWARDSRRHFSQPVVHSAAAGAATRCRITGASQDCDRSRLGGQPNFVL